MRTTSKPIALLCAGAILLAGCGRVERAEDEARPPAPSLTIGLIPERNIFKQIERYEPLARHLSARTGLEIELKVLPHYETVVEGFAAEGLDGAFLGSFSYALARRRQGVHPVARPVNLDGSSTYHGRIFVRADSGIRTAEQMRGKRFAFVDRATTAGYLLPLDYFFTHGVADYGSFLGEAYFAGTHEDAIRDVLDGKADVGAAKSTVFDRLASENDRIRTELQILERSPEVPENGLALARHVPEETREQLAEALLGMHEDPEGKRVLEEFGALRFIPAADEDYAPVYRYAEEIGLNLASHGGSGGP